MAPLNAVHIRENGTVELQIINGGRAGRNLRFRPRGLALGAHAHGPHERAGSIGDHEASHFSVIENISVSEADINELAQAKGANAAGIRVLADVYGISHCTASIGLYLAGGFSRHLDVSASKRVGLIPDLPDDRIVKVGNAALEGAAMALLSRTAKKSAGRESEDGGACEA